jgi:DNA-binding transcriptional regulator YhcF (GntR family)
MNIRMCRSCGANNFKSVINLGKHPWCGDFLDKKKIGKEKYYPLHLVYCLNCKLLQLNFTVPKENMFSNHSYLSSTTSTLKNYFYKLAIENKKQFKIQKNDLILDIGGNDGTQMIQYRLAGMKNVLNVESASNIAKISKRNKIRTINKFFNFKTVVKEIGFKKVKLINASGVFFHLEELHSVLKGINYCLQDNGILIIQFMYAGSMIDKDLFDGIYHEHLCLYSLKSLANLLKLYNLEIFDAYYSEIHSGSIIAKVCKKYSVLNKKTSRLKKTIKNDNKYNLQKIIKFSKRVKNKRRKILEFLTNLKKEKKAKIYCYGAPAKGNTLLNYLGIDSSIITKTVEVNPLKIGLYLPKSHIPIVKEDKNDLPDYYLLLSHNFEREIIKKNYSILRKGVKFITLFPKIRIIDKSSIL